MCPSHHCIAPAAHTVVNTAQTQENPVENTGHHGIITAWILWEYLIYFVVDPALKQQYHFIYCIKIELGYSLVVFFYIESHHLQGNKTLYSATILYIIEQLKNKTLSQYAMRTNHVITDHWPGLRVHVFMFEKGI